MNFGMILFIVFIVNLIVFIIALSKDSDEFIGVGLLSALTVIFILASLLFLKEDNIKPIDVYRGKTTLEITYRDSIPVDSVVVFKKKIEK